jgi:hypothetical protein
VLVISSHQVVVWSVLAMLKLTTKLSIKIILLTVSSHRKQNKSQNQKRQLRNLQSPRMGAVHVCTILSVQPAIQPASTARLALSKKMQAIKKA